MPSVRLFSVLAIFLALAANATAANATAATLEYLDGTKIECKVLAKDATNVTIEVTSAGMLVKRTIPLSKIHKVTINDKVYVINELPAAGAAKVAAKAASPAATTATKGRTKADVDALINQLGRQPPDWYEATPLNHPQSLDLSWPEGPAAGGWNNQKNVGQYVWDIVNPNPGKWREGVKLMHHLLTLHKDDAAKRTRIMTELGRMYHNLHQDYARAAFWWRQAGVDRTHSPPGVSIHLAECYWRLGNKQMALGHIKQLKAIPYDAIKLLADMGEAQEALRLVESIAKNPNNQLHFAYLYGGDACRVSGRYAEALKYYEKVLAIEVSGQQKGQIDRCHKRAAESAAAIKLFDQLDVKKIADGKYHSSAIGYEGPIEVEVAVLGGRIEGVRITKHREKQFYSAMTDTPAKIIAKQGVKGVDATSSATITSEAIINATAKALAGKSQ
jgi:uncharacterized protein with FMN-binding domain